ncbi:MAG: acyl-CoA desaturase [Sphingopyxis sp.]|nr:acyl-CoA desaturase [Sphingopyxis sp.]
MRNPADPHAVNFIVDDGSGDPRDGVVCVDPANLMWNGGMALVALLVGPLVATPAAVTLFFVTTALVLLLGHSIGYHRLLIHGSFQTSAALRRLLVWFGALVGMSGPYGIVRAHDTRDWAQRQPDCHPFLAHQTAPLRDAWWQIYCRLDLVQPPRFDLSELDADPFYRWLERTWRWQQLPIALIFYAIGGWAWVVWGVAARVAVANHGHWLVGHLAHNHGPQRWIVDDSGIQAFDVPWAAIPTMGEAWHNNHHAYPGSARIGLYPGQSDWGYAFIRLLEQWRLVWNVQTPATLGNRDGLRAVTADALQPANLIGQAL